MPATNPVIDRVKTTRQFEHRGNSYQITRSTPFTICDKYYDIIVERKLKRILEIGTQYAQSTLYLAEAAKAIGGSVNTIDKRPEEVIWIDESKLINLHETAERHIEEANLSQYVEFLVGDSNWILPQMIERGDVYDFVLIDGNHDYCVALLDFINADQLVRPGGVIALDDVGALLARRPGHNGSVNRVLPMIFASGKYSILTLNNNVVLCTKHENI